VAKNVPLTLKHNTTAKKVSQAAPGRRALQLSPKPQASEKKARPTNYWAAIFATPARKEVAAAEEAVVAVGSPKKRKSSAKNKKK